MRNTQRLGKDCERPRGIRHNRDRGLTKDADGSRLSYCVLQWRRERIRGNEFERGSSAERWGEERESNREISQRGEGEMVHKGGRKNQRVRERGMSAWQGRGKKQNPNPTCQNNATSGSKGVVLYFAQVGANLGLTQPNSHQTTPHKIFKPKTQVLSLKFFTIRLKIIIFNPLGIKLYPHYIWD